MSDHVTDQPPRVCPSCGQDLSAHPYYQTLPGPTARFLRKIAVILLPVMAVVYFVLLVLFVGGMSFGIGLEHGYLALVVIGGPSLLLYLISRLFPRRRLVICLHCSWNREYPPG